VLDHCSSLGGPLPARFSPTSRRLSHLKKVSTSVLSINTVAASLLDELAEDLRRPSREDQDQAAEVLRAFPVHFE
jgi:hypothetical protein